MSETRRHCEVWRPDESEQRYTEALIQRSRAESREVLRAFAAWLRSERKLEFSTITVRIGSIRVFLDWVSERLDVAFKSALLNLTAAQVEDFFVECGETHGRALRRNMQAALRRFLRFAADRGWADADLASAVPSLVSWRLSGLPSVPSEADLSRLLASPFKFGECPGRDWAIVCLLAIYGVRRGQISALRLEDVSWSERTIEFSAHKGGKSVRHSLSDAVAEALARYLRDERPESDQDWVFLRHRRPYERLSPAAISAVVSMRADRRGLGKLGPHALRHAFASRLLSHDQSMKTIADLLGHRSMSSVGIYAKVDLLRLAELAEEWPEAES